MNWEDVLAELREAHAEEIAPAHYTAVRARVMSELRPRRRRGWLWAGAAMAMVMAVMVGDRLRVEEMTVRAPRPFIPTAELRVRPMPARMPAGRAVGSLHEIVVKIETKDVVIYWIAEDKGDE